MPGMWSKQTDAVNDPLAAYQGKPVFSQGKPNQQYLGRLVVEMLDDGSMDDSRKLAFSAWAATGTPADFTRRVAHALPEKVKRDATSPTSVGPLPTDHLLAAYNGKPIVTIERPDRHYLGRLIVEFWEDGSTDDATKLALSSDAVDGDHLKLRQRIAAALPARV